MPTLSVNWNDPAPLAKRWMEMSGREFLEAIGRHEMALPPILEVLGITEGGMGEGWIEFKMEPQPFMMNLAATLHGGVLATLVDSALTCALVTKLPKGYAATTLDLQMRFFRPARLSAGMLTARAEIVHQGATFAATRGEIRDANDRLIVHATSSLAIAPAGALLNERL
jgi:uncharacterized protein (TIGR00369 family)